MYIISSYFRRIKQMFSSSSSQILQEFTPSTSHGNLILIATIFWRRPFNNESRLICETSRSPHVMHRRDGDASSATLLMVPRTHYYRHGVCHILPRTKVALSPLRRPAQDDSSITPLKNDLSGITVTRPYLETISR